MFNLCSTVCASLQSDPQEEMLGTDDINQVCSQCALDTPVHARILSQSQVLVLHSHQTGNKVQCQTLTLIDGMVVALRQESNSAGEAVD